MSNIPYGRRFPAACCRVFNDLLGKTSHFLFGPSQTGKTFLIGHTLKEIRLYDLLDSSIYQKLAEDHGPA